ncbi:MAG: hypothetical protein KatS3mg111_3057 [Pirellulaceae bacterium]|nr:MAG: hypothetical protein KatS3mg111_3057 [Pirellulaceae bacterium]
MAEFFIPHPSRGKKPRMAKLLNISGSLALPGNQMLLAGSACASPVGVTHGGALCGRKGSRGRASDAARSQAEPRNEGTRQTRQQTCATEVLDTAPKLPTPPSWFHHNL